MRQSVRSAGVRRFAAVCLASAVVLVSAAPAAAASAPVYVPVLVPLTGFLSLEGTSQRNGAMLALGLAPTEAGVHAEVFDTGTSPEGAVTALERVIGRDDVVAIAASMLGTQMLAMRPLAEAYRVPLITVSGTASVTGPDTRYVFRFFPADPVAKRAHARYVVETRGFRRPALITQTTAYGQSGRAHLLEAFRSLGAEVVADEVIDPTVRDMLPVLTRVAAGGPDVLVLHLHAGSTALVIRQARAIGRTWPIVAGSAMHQPSTAALLAPEELAGVCAETASSPISEDRPGMAAFVAEYRARFDSEPDAFALGQYDGMNMVLDAILGGARTAEAVRAALAEGTHRGLAMTYRSDGTGNMAHTVAIICYDGTSRRPRVVARAGDPVAPPDPTGPAEPVAPTEAAERTDVADAPPGR